MSFINYPAKEVNCKIIYSGPGLSGKTTNVQFIYDNTQAERRGKMIPLSTENERTLFFDFLPLGVEEDVRGYKTRLHVFSIPGQTFYELSQEFILKGVDGIVFVADSQSERMDANIESLEALEKSLDRQGYDLGCHWYSSTTSAICRASFRFKSWKPLSIQNGGHIMRPLQTVVTELWRLFKPLAKQ
jgi:hypothetical protein